jgi:hypothetical protein
MVEKKVWERRELEGEVRRKDPVLFLAVARDSRSLLKTSSVWGEVMGKKARILQVKAGARRHWMVKVRAHWVWKDQNQLQKGRGFNFTVGIRREEGKRVFRGSNI